MKSYFSTLSIFVILFLLQSCASFKPSSFDNQTKRYNDYKRNYSIELLDGYSLVSENTRKKLRKIHFQNTPTDTAIFFNKKNNCVLGMWVKGNFPVNSYETKKTILESIEKSLNKACQSNAECNDMNVLISENSVSAEMAAVTELGDGKGIVTSTLFPLSMNSNRHGLHMFLGVSKFKNFEKFKEDYLTMLGSLRLPAFSETVRKLK